jgi:ferritin-like metal-binding protein YciE
MERLIAAHRCGLQVYASARLESMPKEVTMTQQEALINYLEDAEAAERNFEDALATFAKAGEQSDVKQLFAVASERAKTQHQRLEARLRALGGTPSTAKSMLAHLLAFTPTIAQIGQDDTEKNTQHLIMVIGAAAAEMAMYESLAAVAAAANDAETERLARQLQSEEKDDYEKCWNLLRQSAASSFQDVVQRSARA